MDFPDKLGAECFPKAKEEMNEKWVQDDMPRSWSLH